MSERHHQAEEERRGSERKFQLVLNLVMACVGFAFGLAASYVGLHWSETSQRKSIVRFISAAFHNQIGITGPIADSIKSNIERRDLSIETLNLLYHPSSIAELGNEIGCLDPDVISALVMCRDRLRLCDESRQTLLSALGDADIAKRGRAMFYYYLQLEYLVSDEEDALAALSKSYPDIVGPYKLEKRKHLGPELAKFVEAQGWAKVYLGESKDGKAGKPEVR